MKFCPIQKLEIKTYYTGQFANKKADLLVPPMVDPTPVTQNFSYILQLEIEEKSSYDDILNKFKISTTPSVIL